MFGVAGLLFFFTLNLFVYLDFFAEKKKFKQMGNICCCFFSSTLYNINL